MSPVKLFFMRKEQLEGRGGSNRDDRTRRAHPVPFSSTFSVTWFVWGVIFAAAIAGLLFGSSSFSATFPSVSTLSYVPLLSALRATPSTCRLRHWR